MSRKKRRSERFSRPNPVNRLQDGPFEIVQPRKVGGATTETEADLIRRTVATCKGITVSEVTDSMQLGREIDHICTSLVMSLVKPVSATNLMTVGELIQQFAAREAPKIKATK
jgi:hypothetical protein